MSDQHRAPANPESAPLAYEPREAGVSEALPRLAMAMAVAPMIAAALTTAGYVLTDSDAFTLIAVAVAAGGVGCIIASATIMSMWMGRARREGVPEKELWYRLRRVSLAIIVNLAVAVACIAIGNVWASSVLLTVRNVGDAPARDVWVEFVGAKKSFGDIAPGQSRTRRFFPGDGGLTAGWTSEGEAYQRNLEHRAEYRSRTLRLDGNYAFGQ